MRWQSILLGASSLSDCDLTPLPPLSSMKCDGSATLNKISKLSIELSILCPHQVSLENVLLWTLFRSGWMCDDRVSSPLQSELTQIYKSVWRYMNSPSLSVWVLLPVNNIYQKMITELSPCKCCWHQSITSRSPAVSCIGFN